MKVKVYIDKKFSHDLHTDVVPRIGEQVNFGKYKGLLVSDVKWRMKSNGTELLHARLYLS